MTMKGLKNLDLDDLRVAEVCGMTGGDSSHLEKDLGWSKDYKMIRGENG